MSDYGSLDADGQAFMDLLYAESRLRVFPEKNGGATTVPNTTPPPYVVVQIIGERISGERLDLKSTGMRNRAYCQCVGANVVAARRVADLVAQAVLDVRPDVEGRKADPIRHVVGRDPLSSDTTGTTTETITDVYEFATWPGVRES